MKLEKSSSSASFTNGDAADKPSTYHSWLQSRGVWFSYITGVYCMHLLLLSLPFFSVSTVWTLTNTLHSVVTYFFFHHVKGSIWADSQGSERYHTQWEQIDNGEQFTATRKFLTLVPVVLFFLASFYTKYGFNHFLVNSAALLLALVPKLPMFHGFRLFGINKY
ncbi:ORM1-like protein 2 [Diadema setosum]|uniref:ORM1-like protein 2 n=1 Tax=Diadema antillarum TaxID=105358 RepID=UPI003A899D00